MSSTKRAIALFACILLVSAAGAYRVYATNRERAMRQFADERLFAARVAAATLESELAGVAKMLRTMAHTVRGDPAAGTKDVMERQVDCGDPPCLASAALLDGDGRAVLSAGRPLRLAPSDVRTALSRPGDPQSADYVRTLLSRGDPPAMFLLLPAHAPTPAPRPSRDTVILAGEVDFDALFRRQRAIGDDWPRQTMLVLDAKGNVIFHSRHPEMRLNNVRKRNEACFECHETLDYVDRMLADKYGVVRYSLHGVPHTGAFAPLEFQDEQWVAAVMGPSESAVGVVAAQVRHLAMLMFGTLLAVGLAGHALVKDGRRRLQAEADAAHKAHLERSHAALAALNTQLESAALEWRTTVDTIDAAVVVLQPSGGIERMNRAASDLLPGAPFSWLNRPSEGLRDYSPWSFALPLAHEAIDRGVVSTARVRDDASGRTWDLWCRTPRRSDRIGSVVIVARDVTALVELQNSLRRSETMAALGSIVAGVAHEVRNPLFAISSLVDAWAVDNNRNTAKIHGALRMEVSRLTNLMTELLEYGTPAVARPVPYSLSAVITQAIHSCEHEANAREVRITSEIHRDEIVRLDAQRFVRVLINVIQNAVQFSPTGGEVTVTTSRRGRSRPPMVAITVRDQGPGFHGEDLGRVFSPFYSRRTGGFGLGLAISERIAVEHGGRMTAANHPDGGAVLTVWLPAPGRKLAVTGSTEMGQTC